MFRVGRFWEAVGTYWVYAVSLNCALKRIAFSVQSMLFCINTALLRVSYLQLYIIV